MSLALRSSLRIVEHAASEAMSSRRPSEKIERVCEDRVVFIETEYKGRHR